jgi:hypothetical protein
MFGALTVCFENMGNGEAPCLSPRVSNCCECGWRCTAEIDSLAMPSWTSVASIAVSRGTGETRAVSDDKCLPPMILGCFARFAPHRVQPPNRLQCFGTQWLLQALIRSSRVSSPSDRRACLQVEMRAVLCLLCSYKALQTDAYQLRMTVGREQNAPDTLRF